MPKRTKSKKEKEIKEGHRKEKAKMANKAKTESHKAGEEMLESTIYPG
jgi:hypothetical protein